MKPKKKNNETRVVRINFKELVIGVVALSLFVGLPLTGNASKLETAVATEAQKTVTETVKEGAEKAASEVVEGVKEGVKEEVKKAVVKPVKNIETKLDEKVSKTIDGAKGKEDKIPEYVDINLQATCPDLEGLKKDLKSVNHFSHAAHIEMLKKEHKDEFVCATCHHGAKSEDDILKSDKCKRLEKELEAVGGPAKVKNYFHSTCLKCHKDLKKQDKKTGPVSCKGCHSRKQGGEK